MQIDVDFNFFVLNLLRWKTNFSIQQIFFALLIKGEKCLLTMEIEVEKEKVI